MKFSERPKRVPPSRGNGVACPSCGGRATITTTTFGRRDACDGCGLWSWKGKPLADAETHAARSAAHEAFDALWQGPTQITSRAHAYFCLRQELQLLAKDCHMSVMDAATARRVPEAVARIRAHGPKYYSQEKTP